MNNKAISNKNKHFALIIFTVLSILFLFLSIHTLKAQGTVFNSLFIKHKKKADELYNQKIYYKALEHYKIANQKHSSDLILFKIAKCYYYLNYTDSAEIYLKSIEPNSNSLTSEIQLLLAETLVKNGKHEEAIKWYEKCNSDQPQQWITAKLNAIKSYSKFYKSEACYKVSPLSINTKHSEFLTTEFQEEVYVLSNRIKSNFKKKIDVRTSEPLYEWYKYHLSTPQKVSKFDIAKLSGLKGSMTFSSDGNIIVFSSAPKIKNNTYGPFQLYQAESINGKWSKPERINILDKTFTAMHPALSPDGNIMIFSSDMSNGFGGMDLYISKLEDGKWTKPLNLGVAVNTPKDELFPFLNEEGILYFSSDGHPGMGGLDIFKINLENYKELSNLGSPINSPSDDFGIFVKKLQQEGYFSTNRNRGFSDDIYQFQSELNNRQDSVYVVNINDNEIVKSSSDGNAISFTAEKEKVYSINIINQDGKSEYLVNSSFLNQNDSIRVDLSSLGKSEPIEISGNVFDVSTNSPVSGANVIISSLSLEDQVKSSDSNGNFTFRLSNKDAYLIFADKDNKYGVQEGIVDQDNTKVKVGIAGSTSYNNLSVFVIDSSTDQSVEADVELRNLLTGKSERWLHTSLISFKVDSEQKYSLVINKDGYLSTTIEIPNDSIFNNNVAKIRMQRSRSEVVLKGKILNGGSGLPIPDAQIAITSLSMDDQEITSDENGDFAFKGTMGDAILVMGRKDDLSTVVVLDVNDKTLSQTVQLVLHGTAEKTMAGFVQDELSGAPLQDVDISVIDPKSNLPVAFSYQSGVLTIKGRPGQLYRIEARKPGYLPMDRTVPFIDPASDTENLRIRMKRDRSEVVLKGHIFNGDNAVPIPDAEITVTSLSMQDQGLISNENGEFAFKGTMGDAILVMGRKDDLSAVVVLEVNDETLSQTVQLVLHGTAEKTMAGFVQDENSGEPLQDVDINVIDPKSNQPVAFSYQAGILTIKGRPGQLYKIEARKPGYLPMERTVPFIDPASDAEKLRIRMQRDRSEVVLKGSIFDGESAVPIPDAEIIVTSLSMQDQELTSNENGEFAFKGTMGDAMLVMGRKDDLSAVMVLEVNDKTLSQTVQLVLHGTAEKTMAGFVQDENSGEPLPDVDISVIDPKSNLPVAFSYQSGVLTIKGKPGQLYRIEARKPGYLPVDKTVPFIDHTSDTEKLRIRMQRDRAEVVLKGSIFDGDNAVPLLDAEITVTSLSMQDQELKSNENGEFAFKGTMGDVMLVMGRKDDLSAVVVLEVNDETLSQTLKLVLYGTAEKTMAGFVQDENSGEPLPDVDINVIDPKSNLPVAFSYQSGVLTIMGRPGQLYRIEARKPGYLPVDRTVPFIDHTSDTEKLRIRMQRDRSEVVLKGRIFDGENAVPIQDAEIIVTSLSMQDQEITSNENGDFAFKGIMGDAILLMGKKDDLSTVLVLEVNDETLSQTVQLVLHGTAEKTMAGFVQDENSGEPLQDVDINVIDPKSNQPVTFSYQSGVLTIKGRPGQLYRIEARKPGYLPMDRTVPFVDPASDTEKLRIRMQRDQSEMVLKGHLYDGNSGLPIPEAKVTVTSLSLADQDLKSNENGDFAFKGIMGDAVVIMGFKNDLYGDNIIQINENNKNELIKIAAYGSTKPVALIVRDKDSKEVLSDVHISLIYKNGDKVSFLKSGLSSLILNKLEVEEVHIKKEGYKDLVYNYSSDETKRLEVELEAIEQYYTIIGQVIDGNDGKIVGDAKIKVRTTDNTDQNFISDQNGKFKLRIKEDETFTIEAIKDMKSGAFSSKFSSSDKDKVILIPLYKKLLLRFYSSRNSN